MYYLINILKELQEISSYPSKLKSYFQYIFRIFIWYLVVRPFHITFRANYYGIKMFFDSKYDGCRYAYVFPQKDYWIKKIIQSFSKDIKVFFDIGANIGAYGLLAYGRGADVHFFEPNRDLNLILSKTIYGNNIIKNKVNISDFAVAEKNKLVKFYKYNKNVSQKSTTILNNVDTNNYTIEKIRAISLDNYITEHKINKPIFLKIDTEGADSLVIKGTNKAIKKGMVKVIYWETNEQSSIKKITQTVKDLKKNNFYHFAYDNFKKKLRRWRPSDKDCLSVHSSFLQIVNDFQL